MVDRIRGLSLDSSRSSMRRSYSVEPGRSMSVASNWSGSVDLTYRDYFGPPNRTPFDEKMIELDFLKYETKVHMKKLNALKYNYMDWFSRKVHSFLDSVKLIQILAVKLVPSDINSMKDFKKVHDMCIRFPRNGTPRDSGPSKMDDFSMFWLEMLDLKATTDEIYEKACKYCDSINRLRQPSIKLEIDRLYQKLTVIHAEDFEFTELKNERDNLFVYKVAPFDYKYHGLVGYIPYLHTLSVRLLHWITKLHLEKE